MNSINCYSTELTNKIMATTLYFKLCSNNKSKLQIKEDINYLITKCKKFETNYSRFISNNNLDIFNNSEKGKIDKEFYNILKISKKYYQKTAGIFDIGILPTLEAEGYVVSKLKGYVKSKNKKATNNFVSVDKLSLLDSYYFEKPLQLKIDLGGIGKSYLINKLKNIILKKGYKDFIIDIGGDIYFGTNPDTVGKSYICGICNPHNVKKQVEYLKLRNIAVATSTVTKRKWVVNKKLKNHLIDIKTGRSTKSSIIQCTVINKNIVKADILAKSLLLMGLRKAITYAKINKIATVIVSKKLKLYKTEYVKKYIYN